MGFGLDCVLEEAGADAVELNLSCPHGLGAKGLGRACGQNPARGAPVGRWAAAAAASATRTRSSTGSTAAATVGATAGATAGAAAAGETGSVRALNSLSWYWVSGCTRSATDIRQV